MERLPSPLTDTKRFAHVSFGVFVVASSCMLLVIMALLSVLMARKSHRTCVMAADGKCKLNALGGRVLRETRSFTDFTLLIFGFLFTAAVVYMLVQWLKNIMTYVAPGPDPCLTSLALDTCDAEAFCKANAGNSKCYTHCSNDPVDGAAAWCLGAICPWELDNAFTIDKYASVDPRCVGWCDQNFEARNCANYSCYNKWDPAEADDPQCYEYCSTQPLTNEACVAYNCGSQDANTGHCACQANLYSAQCSAHCTEVIETGADDRSGLCEQWACAQDPRAICETACTVAAGLLADICTPEAFSGAQVTITQQSSGLVLVADTATPPRLQYVTTDRVRSFARTHWRFVPQSESGLEGTYYAMASDTGGTRYVVVDHAGGIRLEQVYADATIFVLVSAGLEGVFELRQVAAPVLANKNYRRLNSAGTSARMSFYDSRTSRTSFRLQNEDTFGSGAPFQWLLATGTVLATNLPTSHHPALHPANGTVVRGITDLSDAGWTTLWCAIKLDATGKSVLLMSHAYPGALLVRVGSSVELRYFRAWGTSVPSEATWTLATFLFEFTLSDPVSGLVLTAGPLGLALSTPSTNLSSGVYRYIGVSDTPVRDPSYTLSGGSLVCATLDAPTLAASVVASYENYIVPVRFDPFARAIRWLVGTLPRYMVIGACVAGIEYETVDEAGVHHPIPAKRVQLLGAETTAYATDPRFVVDRCVLGTSEGDRVSIGGEGGALLQRALVGPGTSFIVAQNYLDGDVRLFSDEQLTTAVVLGSRGNEYGFLATSSQGTRFTIE